MKDIMVNTSDDNDDDDVNYYVFYSKLTLLKNRRFQNPSSQTEDVSGIMKRK
jgi:hypothetical protein